MQHCDVIWIDSPTTQQTLSVALKEPTLFNIFIGHGRGNKDDICVSSASQRHKTLLNLLRYAAPAVDYEPSFFRPGDLQNGCIDLNLDLGALLAQNLSHPSTSRNLSWAPSTLLKPFMERTELYRVFDRRISRQHSDRKVLADVFDPAALADRPQPKRDRFIEAFGRHFSRVLDSFGIPDGDAAGSDRHRRRVAYSPYLRYPSILHSFGLGVPQRRRGAVATPGAVPYKCLFVLASRSLRFASLLPEVRVSIDERCPVMVPRPSWSLAFALMLVLSLLAPVVFAQKDSKPKIMNRGTDEVYEYPNGATCIKPMDYASDKSTDVKASITKIFSGELNTSEKVAEALSYSPSDNAVRAALFDACTAYGSGTISQQKYNEERDALVQLEIAVINREAGMQFNNTVIPTSGSPSDKTGGPGTSTGSSTNADSAKNSRASTSAPTTDSPKTVNGSIPATGA